MIIRVLFLAIFFIGQAIAQDQLLVVHRKSMRVDLWEEGMRVGTYPIRVGRDRRKTPIGKGIITEKNDRPIFRYVDPGPNQGKVVRFSECEGGLVRVDYKKMRALRMRYTEMAESEKEIRRRNLIPNGEERFSFHSVTCDETIGEAISKGCVGLSVPDMLSLFDAVRVDSKKKIYPHFEVRDD